MKQDAQLLSALMSFLFRERDFGSIGLNVVIKFGFHYLQDVHAAMYCAGVCYFVLSVICKVSQQLVSEQGRERTLAKEHSEHSL